MRGLIIYQNGIKITFNDKNLSKICIRISYLNCQYLTKVKPPKMQLPFNTKGVACLGENEILAPGGKNSAAINSLPGEFPARKEVPQ